jgi:hypothetical protein
VGPIPPAGNWVPPADNAWKVWNDEAAAENVPDPAWEQPQAQNVQQHPAQLQSTVSFQLSDFSNSSMHMILGPGPAQEVFIQQPHLVAHEVVLVEDTDESDDEVFLPPGQAVNVQIDQNAYHPWQLFPMFLLPTSSFSFMKKNRMCLLFRY